MSADLQARLLAAFVDELGAHHDALERVVLAAERKTADRGSAAIELLRTLHTLKGAARAVGQTDLEARCHQAEARLVEVRDGERPFDDRLIGELLELIDLLASRRRELARGEVDASGEDDDARGREVVRIAAGKLDALQAAADALSLELGRDAHGEPLAALRASLTRLEAIALELPAGDGALIEELGRLHRGLDGLERGLERRGGALARAALPLDDAIRQLRLTPLAETCESLTRMVRDLARATGKQVALECQVGGIELDRGLLDALRDPLVHLVRNAVDHGIEPAPERLAAGKPAGGVIRIAAALVGDLIELVVADDGRGLQRDRLREAAARRGLRPTGDRELVATVFLPGLSTVEQATDLSGRGVGLDVVKSRIAALRGAVDVSDVPGAGTRFTLSVPLSLTKVRAAVVAVGEQRYVVPSQAIARIVRPRADEVRQVDGRSVVDVEGALVAVSDLAVTLGGAARPAAARMVAAVLESRRARHAFWVESVASERDVVIRSLGSRLAGARYVLGAATLPDGGLALALDPAELVLRAAADDGQRPAAMAVESPRRRRILLADDSVTTRNLERIILESAGYEVLVASDGLEAWHELQRQPVDLVVSDVEMPRMSGIALTEAIRGAERLAGLPVVLLTGLGSEADRRRGLEAGASAYLVKTSFDQKELLDLVAQLL